MNAKLRSLFVLFGIAAMSAGAAFAGEVQLFTGSYGHTHQWVTVPTTATVTVTGDPTNDPSSYISGWVPISPYSYYHTAADGPVYFEGTISAGTHEIDQWVGSNGYSCTHVGWDDPPPPPPPAGSVGGVSLTTGSGWEIFPNLSANSSMTLYNAYSDTFTLRARDQGGNMLASNVQWHVTDLIDDVVTHDWVTQPSITFNDLWSGKAYKIKSRTIGSSSECEVELSFAEGTYELGAGGNPGKIRTDNSWPYGAERISGCALASLRNILHFKGMPVPTEDDIMDWLKNLGADESKYLGEGPGYGMSTAETEERFNEVLNPFGLQATRQGAISRQELQNLLDNGAVVAVGTKLVKWDENHPESGVKTVGHMLVMHKVYNIFGQPRIEIIDPADGTRKRFSFDEALDKVQWDVSPREVWKVSP